jgi:cysteine synthase
MRYYNDILKLVGNTPLVKINKINPNPNVLMLAKLERFNPAGSVKDRIALRMIEQAEVEGKLTKDRVIIEPTSGNTGIGLALVASVKGYMIELVMPESMSVERRKILTALGAKITLTPADKGMNGAEDYVRKAIKDNPDRYYHPDQFSNPSNPEAHYLHTAQEIIEDTDGQVDVFIAGLGTSGTLMGVSKGLKEYNPNIKIIAVEPTPKQGIQGLKNLETSYVPKIFDESKIDEKRYVTIEKAEHGSRILALQEGLFCGISSGAAIHVAIEVASRMEKGIIVVLLPDGGEKYISHEIYSPERCLECVHRCQLPTLWTDDYIESIKTWWENK